MDLNCSPVKQSVCTSVIKVNNMAILLLPWTKNPIKVVTEAKFLGVVFYRNLLYKNHVNSLNRNCLKTLDILKVVGHIYWGALP